MPEFPTLKDIAERPEPFEILPWALAGIGIALITIALAYIFYPQWKRVKLKPKMPGLVDPKRAALSELKQLEDAQQPIQISQEVQRIVRTYLHRKHGALGLYRTADELLGKDGIGTPPLPPPLAPFAAVLRQAEELRYGRARSGDKALIISAIAALEADSSPDSKPSSRVTR